MSETTDHHRIHPREVEASDAPRRAGPLWRRGAVLSPPTSGTEGYGGYTLIELLIVVAIVAIFAGVALTRFEPGIHDRLQSAAQIAVADLAYARNLAVTNNSTYRITFDLDNNLYVLRHSGSNTALDNLPSSAFRDSQDPPDGQTTDFTKLPMLGGAIELVAVQKRDIMPVDVADVEFGPLGGTTRTEDTVIWLGSGVGDARRFLSVCLDPVSGIASIGEVQTTPPLSMAGPEDALIPTSSWR